MAFVNATRILDVKMCHKFTTELLQSLFSLQPTCLSKKKLNVTHQILVYADNVNILGGCTHTVRKNTEALVIASKQIGLEVDAKKTKYMVMSRDQNIAT